MGVKAFQYFLIFIVAVTLNSSVDIPDYLLYQNNSERNNSSNFNEIESVAELVCENVLNIHGQFPDKKNDAATHHQHSKKIGSVKILNASAQLRFTGFTFTSQVLPIYYQPYFNNFTRDILSPPPQKA